MNDPTLPLTAALAAFCSFLVFVLWAVFHRPPPPAPWENVEPPTVQEILQRNVERVDAETRMARERTEQLQLMLDGIVQAEREWRQWKRLMVKEYLVRPEDLEPYSVYDIYGDASDETGSGEGGTP